MLCGAPLSRSSYGRSAVSTSRGTWLNFASTSAGKKFAAAVPDVHSKATGLRNCFAIPSPKNAAERSSTCIQVRIAVCATKAMARWVEREPGQITTFRIPARCNSSTNTTAYIYAGFAESCVTIDAFGICFTSDCCHPGHATLLEISTRTLHTQSEVQSLKQCRILQRV